MKKRRQILCVVCMVCISMMTVSGLAGCGAQKEVERSIETMSEATDSVDVSGTEEPELQESTYPEVEEEDSISLDDVIDNFIYTEENNEITITGYEGESCVVEVPQSINEVPVVAIGNFELEDKGDIECIYTDGEYVFCENADTTVTIIAYIGEETILSIPETLGGKTVTTIGQYAFLFEPITELILPDTIIVLEGGCFRATKLQKVTLSNNLEVVGNRAFSECRDLTGVVLPESVTELGIGCFESTDLTTINFPEGVSEIGPHAFNGTPIKEITIPGTVKIIGEEAFRSAATRVVIEEGVEIIDDLAFGGYTEYIDVPDSVVEIGTDAFGKVHDKLIVGQGSVAESYAKENDIPYEIRE